MEQAKSTLSSKLETVSLQGIFSKQTNNNHFNPNWYLCPHRGVCCRYVHVASVLFALERFYLLTAFCDVRPERAQRERKAIKTRTHTQICMEFNRILIFRLHGLSQIPNEIVGSINGWVTATNENPHEILSSSEFVHYFRFETSASPTQSCWHLHITQCLNVQRIDQLLHSIPLWT